MFSLLRCLCRILRMLERLKVAKESQHPRDLNMLEFIAMTIPVPIPSQEFLIAGVHITQTRYI